VKQHSPASLLAAAKRDTPRANLEHDILGAIGAGTIVLAPTFGSKLWMALKHAAVSKAGIATIAFTAATGGYAAGRLQERAIQEEHATGPVDTTRTPTTLTPTLTPTPTLTLTQTAVAAVAETPPRTQTPEARTLPPPTTTSSTTRPTNAPVTSLADEVEVIKRARASILAKNADGARAALDLYDRTHPDGAMSEEALALRVRADRLAGDDVAAAEALTKLEKRFPESVQLPGLRAAR